MQSIKEHLEGVAILSKEYAIDIMKDIAYKTSMMHDIGKYSEVFQNKLINDANIKYEHSICGAIEYQSIATSEHEKCILPMIQYCIAGHHSGLPDGGNKNSSPEEGTLCGRLKREKYYIDEFSYNSYKDEINITFPEITSIYNELQSTRSPIDLIEKYAFFTRYLFSCLTDADFIDTESFCNPETDRMLSTDFISARQAIIQKIDSFKCETKLQKARRKIQDQAFERSRCSEKLSILNMPTGSGKTLCSLKIALDKILYSEKKRIIYVIPYTSIIEQTANVFNNIFGKYVSIVQHHSNYSFDDISNEPVTNEKLKRSTENWDAPVIITTSVQFFESFYHYKSSRLRKLHNLSDSVIVFDEIHMLPEKYLQPCIRAIGYITKYLNSEAIFLSATMPDYSVLFQNYISECSYTELIHDKTDFSYFQKCKYINLGKTDYDSIIDKTMNYKSNLIIVNKRKTAREIYKKLSGNKFHLSTYMTPHDRLCTIEKIKQYLESGQPVTVVSTSLIEAGVDLDFETVFREISGLDSILQSGGRCNREGLREIGSVFIFSTDNSETNDLKPRISIVKDLISNGMEISSEEAIKEYYRRLFRFKDDIISRNTIAKNVGGFEQIPFRSYAESFEFISSETISVVINNSDETNQILNLIEYGKMSGKRKLQKYSISLRKHDEFDKAISIGIISDTGKGVFVLTDNNYYNSQTGLDLEMTNDQII